MKSPLVLLPLLLLSACAVNPPATPTPSQTQVQSSIATPTPTPEPSVTPTPTPAVELNGKGIADLKFGADELDAQTALIKALGAPDDGTGRIACELDKSSPYVYEETYAGHLRVTYAAKDRKEGSKRTFVTWSWDLENTMPSQLALADGIDVRASFAALREQFPKSKYEMIGLNDDTYLLTLPNKIKLIGEESASVVMAGKLFLCE
ncbi:MAG: hypothetical protein LBR21_07800 [Propionibacteriaceae bacterium]|jgi:hypothetical protein|nr:hypothetical protein [Propionibacteriaceae bacterium]